MDQGVIRSFKCHYRKLIVQKLVGANDRREFVKSLNIKKALWAAAASWDSIEIQTDITCVAPFAIISEDEIVDMVTQSQEDELDSNAEQSDGGNAD